MDAIPACGMGIRPIRYKPAGGRYADQVLNGLQLTVENPDAFYPVTAGTIIFAAIMHRHPHELSQDARPEWLDKLAGSTAVRDAYQTNALGALFQSWIDEQDAYLANRVNLYA